MMYYKIEVCPLNIKGFFYVTVDIKMVVYGNESRFRFCMIDVLLTLIRYKNYMYIKENTRVYVCSKGHP